jgi:hypothetical protein
VVIQTTESLESNATGGGDRPKDQSDDPDKVKYVSRTGTGTTAAAAEGK